MRRSIGQRCPWLKVFGAQQLRSREQSPPSATAQLQIEAQRKASGHYPSPDLEGRLVIDAQPLTDAFGRPFQYSLSGRWKTQSYRLSSLGADGTANSDDLCVANRSRLAALAERIVEPLAALELLRGSDATWTSKLQAVRDARCAEQFRKEAVLVVVPAIKRRATTCI